MPGPPGAGRAKAPAATDLNAAVRTVVDFLEAQGMFRGHEVELSARSGGCPRCAATGTLLEQVVVNLVANACQAARGAGLAIGTLATALEPRGNEARATDEDAPQPSQAARWATQPRRRELPAGSPRRDALRGR